ELGILPDHTPLISQLKTGVLSYRQGNEDRRMHVSGGFIEGASDNVSVFLVVAGKPEEDDVNRAQRPRRSARSSPACRGEDIDFNRAELKLQRAMIRIQVGSGE